MESGLLIGGKWVSGGEPLEVRNKYSGAVVQTLACARKEDVSAAVAAAVKAAPAMAEWPAHRRADLLGRTAKKLVERREELAKTIVAEVGKALRIARVEVDRAAAVFELAAEEAKRIHGETVPLDAVPSGEGYFGFWQRRPVGVVAAITPFNFPLNLVAHKVAPSIAAGNALVLKPAENTPLSAVLLCQILQQEGLPEGGVNLIQGPGESVGEWLVTDPRVAKISFTGSRAVGERITRKAGIKKVTLELGNTSPVIVAADANLEDVAKRCAFGSAVNAGQVCISVQRIYGEQKIYGELGERLASATKALRVGDPMREDVDVGPMIAEKEAVRAEAWVNEAAAAGAKVLAGGKREGAIYHPTVLSEVRAEMKVVAQEVFAPVCGVQSFAGFEQALERANASDYGLQAAVFTQDIDRVLHAIRRLDFGGVMINEIPAWRADHMPYGGNRQSGLGREGVRFAIEEMTNIQMVVIRAKK
ncbi:MAG: aldehyde dehydrogenase family protein [Planctomycetes bacterium]|nr:aldehyde dehydrogenase family protein [Planctomycetota bacterium]